MRACAVRIKLVAPRRRILAAVHVAREGLLAGVSAAAALGVRASDGGARARARARACARTCARARTDTRA